MIQLFEAGIINHVKEKIKNKYGIEFPFKYHPDLNIIDEYRKNRFWNSNFDQTNKLVKDMLGDNVANNMAVWNRTPIVRDDDFGGNMYGTQLVFKTSDGRETIQDMFFGKTTFSVSFFSTENKILYFLELAYNMDFMLNSLKIPLKYKINGVVNEINYACEFTNISTSNFIDVDNMGGLRYINFEFTVSGLFFSPFYSFEDNKIEEIDLKVFVMNKTLNINDISNYNESTKACEEKCEVENNHIVDGECVPPNSNL